MTWPPTAERAISAYGGRSLWSGPGVVEATVSAGGLAFGSRGWPALSQQAVRADVTRPVVEFLLPDFQAVLSRFDNGQVAKAGSNLSAGQLYFAGYALWNYLVFPSLLLRPDVTWRELKAGLLEARFPPTLPTHCEKQRFSFDALGLLERHDYTARFFGRWAVASNRVLSHGTSGGLPFPNRRVVTPRIAGAPLPGPTLVRLEVHQWRLIPR